MASGTKEAMKKSRFSEEQMVKILRETDKHSVAQVAKKHGVSEQTISVDQKLASRTAGEPERCRS
jgi:putative transposase